ncbi:NAD(P)H-binding protein [Streptomyces sp. NPDC046887]|uniref:NAD(P)H-binding protein n=1 Tax=Streptomyces sp. NPDC046887 TaxID=3155472 RepID=UPI0033E3039F
MPRPATILVTGATGTTGSRLVRRLVDAGHPVRAAARRPRPAAGAESATFDWNDPDTHRPAVDGAAAVYLIPPPGTLDPVPVMLPFLDLARRAGVRRAVLLSSSQVESGGPGAGGVHRVLPELFPEWAVLRPSWFMQNLTGQHQHAEAIRRDGLLTTATGEGRVAFVDADDIAAVAAYALTDPVPHNTDRVLTGPRPLSYAEAAAVLGEATGRPVRHRPVTVAEMTARYAPFMPEEFAALLAGLDGAIAEGAEDRVTDEVERVTGRPPRSFEEHVRTAVAAKERTVTAAS